MIIKYGLICEDIAQRSFLENFLEKQNDVFFQLDQEFYNRFRVAGNNNKQVIKSIPQIGYQLVEKYHLDFLFVGLDYDDRNQSDFDKELEQLYLKIDKNVRAKSVVFFPVQAIEHWLLYLKFKIDDPKSTKNVSYENINRKNVKREIFGEGKNSDYKTKIIISKLTSFDFIDWLKTRSTSFQRFNSDFNNAIQKLKSF
ncbi:MAG: hypothetical protein JXL97_07840 [Bacteroidales bacterium]|nr:hypothetical protein [Bacteroidales bacterium]